MNVFKRVFYFYVEGFRNMNTTGRKLWTIIIIKLAIMFLVLKLFFFPNILNTTYDTDEEKANHVHEQLTNTNKNTNTDGQR